MTGLSDNSSGDIERREGIASCKTLRKLAKTTTLPAALVTVILCTISSASSQGLSLLHKQRATVGKVCYGVNTSPLEISNEMMHFMADSGAAHKYAVLSEERARPQI